jgi:hypothetical protein
MRAVADAELSSINATVDELRGRIARLAEGHESKGDEDAATELYEVERSLAAATRRLTRLVSRD